ncbi:MAG: glycosyltransferase family 39 protein, partial [Anaerolineae bacterium]|nr:glycosyltransferase family 39 protein [Anaerolineae bacterium]
FHISRSVGDIWQRISTEDVWQAPLYAYSLSAWGSVVGWTEFATRALSLLAGLVALAGVFRLGWALSKRPLVGWGAAALLGTSVWFIYFLHEMRVYMLLVMFTVLLLLFYRRVMYGQREPKLWHFIALGLITGLLINTHYFAALVVGVVGLWHLAQLIRKRPTRRWWGIIGAWVLSGLMAIPWLINVGQAVAPTNKQARVTADLNLLLHITGDTFTAFSNAGVALLIVLLALSLLSRRARWVWFLGVVLLLLNLAGYYIFGLIELRYNIALLPFLALLAGFGLDELAQRRIPPILIIGIWLVSALSLDGNFQMDRIIQHWPGQPIREMAQAIEPLVAPEDVIVDVVGDEDRTTLAAHSMVYYMGDFGARIEVVENNLQPNVQNFAARMRKAAGDAPRLWLMRDPRWINSVWDLSEYTLNQQNLYRCTTVADTAKLTIWGFGRVDPKGQGWQYGDGIHLSMLGKPRIKEGLLQVWLGYQIDVSVPANTYSVGLYVFDTSNQVRAQYDGGLPAAGTSCQTMDIATTNLPAGVYQLGATIYNWQSGERLKVQTPDGTQSDMQMIGTVTVTFNPHP